MPPRRTPSSGRIFHLVIVLGLSLAAAAARGEAQFRNRDNPDPRDAGDPEYPIPYQLPREAEIRGVLERIRDYLRTAAPVGINDQRTGHPITDLAQPVASAVAATGPAGFSPLAYEMGVVHAGLLRAQEVTGDRAFGDFIRAQVEFLARSEGYFAAQEAAFHLGRKNSLVRLLDPRALDDCGSMCAALIRDGRAGLGPEVPGAVSRWSEWIAHGQFRLADGTLARQRPQAQSLWADDLYMAVPALAELGRSTGDDTWWQDAIRDVRQTSARLYNPEKHLYAHGWNANNPDAPQFYWGRASGWAVLAFCELLDVLPPGHPGYAEVLGQLREILRGVAAYQGGAGLWHQLLDRNDTFLETSASAMFVYGYAHAINRGWISPTTYGSIAQAGWCGLVTKVNDRGQVEGGCVATTFAGDAVYYYNRPVSVNALHGYGPMLLAGAEMIALLRNPEFTIEYKLRTYHYVPKAGGPTNYSEHP